MLKHSSVKSNKILEFEELELFEKRGSVGIIFGKGGKCFLLMNI